LQAPWTVGERVAHMEEIFEKLYEKNIGDVVDKIYLLIALQYLRNCEDPLWQFLIIEKIKAKQFVHFVNNVPIFSKFRLRDVILSPTVVRGKSSCPIIIRRPRG
jgi:hypothetical protein